ncbi:enolase C-terminal domain-like protein [Spongiactinospora sp. TRM90649]|uniref:enolase C-terminal domain-like protein n=1 Tax=Spongiactinospora sp. TRM90649 TaxID=3031114 RepID=UPI0023FA344E|nr:enolase C-terminal domain-like protein [Spongiactinospora sp. TRM90649]MDF5758327.1 enolase C-terminal domain-like protein [Spongiactinospora sp. TRM90649]
MRITDVRCVEYTGSMSLPGPLWEDRLRRPTDVYPERAAEGPAQPPLREDGGHEVRAIFLHVDTDEGITGSTAVLSEQQAHTALTLLRPGLLGADPLAAERIWDLGYRSMIHGRAGTGMLALSAVDCALWDVRGQYFGVPAYVLLGGPTRDDVPAYASTLGDSLAVGDASRRTRELVAEGFGGVKWFPRWGPGDGHRGVDRVVELVATVRQAGGEDLDIMLDAWSSWDIQFTVDVARECAPLRLRWIEEPLPADDTAGYAALRRRLGGLVQISGGEHEYTRWGVGRLLREDLLDVYQADPHWGGGISEMVKISALVSAAGRQFIPHGQSLQCNAALTFAASPGLIPEMEYLLRLGPLYQHFLADPIVPAAGRVTAPATTGLGMRLADDRVLDARPL